MRKGIAAVLAGALLLSPVRAAESGFSDVPGTAWYAADAAYCNGLGLMNGTGDGRFSPDGIVSDGEVLTVCARLHSHFQGGGWDLQKAPDPWGSGAIFVKNSVKLFSFTNSDFGTSIDWKFQGEGFALFLRVDEKTAQALTPAGGGGAAAELELNGVRLAGGVLTPCAQAPDGLELGTGPVMALTMPVTPELKEAEAAFQRAAGPDVWCRDALYHLERSGFLGGSSPYWEPDQISHPATRAELAWWLGRVLPEAALSPINQVDTLPDTDDPAVLSLYRAGILAGSDEYGTFRGSRGLARAELCAIVSRTVDPERRVRFTLKEPVYMDYELTPLLPGYTVENEAMLTPDRMYAARYGADGKLRDSGILWADGSFHPLDLSRYEWSSFPGQTLIQLTEPKTGRKGILDVQDGSYPVALGSYETCDITSDGQILFRAGPEDPLRLLDAKGAAVAVLPELDARWTLCDHGLVPRRDPDTGLWGYADLSGTWVLPPQWNETSGFMDGYAVVGDGTRMGAIDRTGAAVLPCQYAFLRPIGGGYYYCEKADGGRSLIGVDGTSWPPDLYASDGAVWSNGFISSYDRILDTAGTPVTPAFDSSTSASVGPVDKDGSAFVILDRKVYRLRFTQGARRTSDFTLTRLDLGENRYYFPMERIWATGGSATPYSLQFTQLMDAEGEKWGYADLSGRVIAPAVYDEVAEFCPDGAAAVRKNGLWGYIDAQGREIVPCAYRRVQTVHDGVLACTRGGWTEPQTMETFDAQGRVLGTFSLEDVGLYGSFSQGLCAFYRHDGDFNVLSRGYLDARGKVAFEVDAEVLYDFSGGLAAVSGRDGGLDFVDRTGRVVFSTPWEPGFGEKPFGFHEGLAVVRDPESGLHGAIDAKGTLVLPLKYEWLEDFSDGLAHFSKPDGTCGYVDRNGAELGLGYYGQAFSGGYAVVYTVGGDYGYIDKTGAPATPMEFSAACPVMDGKAVVQKDGELWVMKLG